MQARFLSRKPSQFCCTDLSHLWPSPHCTSTPLTTPQLQQLLLHKINVPGTQLTFAKHFGLQRTCIQGISFDAHQTVEYVKAGIYFHPHFRDKVTRLSEVTSKVQYRQIVKSQNRGYNSDLLIPNPKQCQNIPSN